MCELNDKWKEGKRDKRKKARESRNPEGLHPLSIVPFSSFLNLGNYSTIEE
jgi:hypothetical protein